MSDMSGWAQSLDNEFDMDDWQLAQSADECVIQREIVEALEHARPSLTDDEFQLLAWAAGVREAFNQGVTR